MTNNQSKSIEVVPVDRPHTDLQQLINNMDPLQSFHLFLAILAVITGIKNLLRYTKKLTSGKISQIDRKLILQVVGAILAILKAISQLFDSLGDRDDAE